MTKTKTHTHAMTSTQTSTDAGWLPQRSAKEQAESLIAKFMMLIRQLAVARSANETRASAGMPMLAKYAGAGNRRAAETVAALVARARLLAAEIGRLHRAACDDLMYVRDAHGLIVQGLPSDRLTADLAAFDSEIVALEASLQRFSRRDGGIEDKRVAALMPRIIYEATRPVDDAEVEAITARVQKL
ncbi:MAG: hypothetical protein WC241_05175 [Candidatus Paceibacterota bacterium]